MANAPEAERIFVPGDNHAESRPQAGILSSLQRAQAEMAELISGWETRVNTLEAQLAEAREELTRAQSERQRLAEDADVAHRQMDHLRVRSERQEQRASQMAGRVREIHRGVIGGDVYGLTLRACLEMTGATRGLYLTSDREERVRVCAAEGVEPYPHSALSAPSEYVAALARRVMQHDRAFICHTDADATELPPPGHPTEQFQNCVAARFLLLKDLTGVIIVGDRADAEFDEEDVETLLSIGQQAAVAVQNAHLQRRSLRAYAGVFSVLASSLENRSGLSDGGERAVRLARLTGQRLGLTGDDLSVVTHATALRDLGKLGISDGVLNKPGPLTPEERDLVRSHVRLGHEWVRRAPSLRGVADAILRHHERWDGAGYPSGLRGENIPLAARIVGAVDSYVAMLSHRSHRAALSPETAREEIARGAGAQFDPRVAEALLAVIDAETAGAAPLEDGTMEILPGFSHVARETATSV